MGFSDRLWALLVRAGLEERASSPSVRSNITDIAGQLHDEVKAWNQTGRRLALSVPAQRTARCVFHSIRARWCVADQKIVAEGCIESSEFQGQLVTVLVYFRRYPREGTRTREES